MDVTGELVFRDGDGVVQEGKGGVRNGPDEFEGKLEGVGEVHELLELLAGARGSTNAIINITEKEWTLGQFRQIGKQQMRCHHLKKEVDKRQDIMSTLDNGELVNVVYLDFQTAFDKVSLKRLLPKITVHGVT
eukprot:g32501.t1